MPLPENIKRMGRVLEQIEKMDRAELLFLSQKINDQMDLLSPPKRDETTTH